LCGLTQHLHHGVHREHGEDLLKISPGTCAWGRCVNSVFSVVRKYVAHSFRHSLCLSAFARNDGYGYNFLMPNKLTHLDEQGRARMVDVGHKPDTERIAIARGEVHMKKETLALIHAGQIRKGDVLTVAQIAGISASKRTSELIPLCHPLPLTQVEVDLVLDDSLPGVVITATAKTIGKTGVEMEALTAVSVAALTVYDMAKAAEKTMRIENIRLVEKHGGQSGDVVNE
jgi:cyclic pyranopterin phosphate synthase